MNKKYLTEKQIQNIKHLENKMLSALKFNVKKASSYRENKLLEDTLNEYTGKEIKRNLSCGSCLLTLYKEIGQVYFESVKYYESITAELTNPINVPDEKTIKQPTKKRGRPKKITK